jgi:hypothetical protein
MTNEIQVQKQQPVGVFGQEQAFELAQRQAKALAESDLVPATYKGKLANCLVALEMAQRCQASPLAIMQSLNIIQGKPSWSSSYTIAAINSSGRFSPLKFKMEGTGDARTCTAYSTDKSGELIEGPPVSIGMARAEGWYDRNGSKWKTMPELMLRYRAAAFFGRLYAPEILFGMRTEEEEREVIDVTNSSVVTPQADQAAEINKKIRNRKVETTPPVEIVPPITPSPNDGTVEHL